jgi:hypothetical protein
MLETHSHRFAATTTFPAASRPPQPPLKGSISNPKHLLNNYLFLLFILISFVMRFLGLNNLYWIEICVCMILVKSLNHTSCFIVNFDVFGDEIFGIEQCLSY